MSVEADGRSATWSHWKWAHEAFADFNLEDFGCAKEEEGITQACWQTVFTDLARTNSSMVSVSDLHDVEDNGRNARNLTRQELKVGLAMAVRLFPEESARLVTNANLIISTAFRNKLPPATVPAPEDPLANAPKLPKAAASLAQERGLRLARANASAAVELYGAACVKAVIGVATAAMGIGFGILGIELPGGDMIADMVVTNSKLVGMIINIVKSQSATPDLMAQAQDVVKILQLLWDEGVLTQAVQESLKELPWWRWSIMVTQILGTIAAWFASGGVGLAISIALVITDAVDLGFSIKETVEECSG